MKPVSKLRTNAASLAIAGSGVFIVVSNLLENSSWPGFGIGALLVGAGALMRKRAALPQVLARGVAWSLVFPMIVIVALALAYGYTPGVAAMVPSVLATLGLALGRPLLDTEEARASFAPAAFRRSFLAASTAAIGIGLMFASMAISYLWLGARGDGLEHAALAVGLLASGVGVVRLRTWGVLAGVATAALALVLAILNRHEFLGMGVATAAIPGAAMAGIIAAARAGLGRREERAAPRIRIAVDASANADAEANADASADANANANEDADADAWASGARARPHARVLGNA